MSDEEINDFEEVPFLCQINKSVKVVTHVVYHIVTRTHTNELYFNFFYLP
jgi:hypothetical protein